MIIEPNLAYAAVLRQRQILDHVRFDCIVVLLRIVAASK
jgi:hypothetical protein